MTEQASERQAELQKQIPPHMAEMAGMAIGTMIETGQVPFNISSLVQVAYGTSQRIPRGEYFTFVATVNEDERVRHRGKGWYELAHDAPELVDDTPPGMSTSQLNRVLDQMARDPDIRERLGAYSRLSNSHRAGRAGKVHHGSPLHGSGHSAKRIGGGEHGKKAV